LGGGERDSTSHDPKFHVKEENQVGMRREKGGMKEMGEKGEEFPLHEPSGPRSWSKLPNLEGVGEEFSGN